MRKIERVLEVVTLVLLLFIGRMIWKAEKGRTVYAQTITVPFSYSVGTGTHTSCPAVVASTTQYCFPSDGPWVSINGAAWQAIPLTSGAAGVTGIVVCNVTGSTCSSLQTGAVTLNIPKTATVPATSATLN